MKVYMWRDRFDGDMVQLGIDARGGFVCWGQMHIDGIGETFGEEVIAELRRSSLLSVHRQDEQPILVEASQLVIQGEPVSS